MNKIPKIIKYAISLAVYISLLYVIAKGYTAVVDYLFKLALSIIQ